MLLAPILAPVLPLLFGPNSAKSRSQLLDFGSWSLQERSQRLSRNFLKASASKIRFGTDFGPVLGPILETPDLKN